MNRYIFGFGFALVFLGATSVWSAPAATAEASTEPLTAFGYDIFKGLALPVTEGPVDEDYLVGPRDELMIETWGEYTKKYPVRVGDDGEIDIEAEGLRILVNGLTLRQVKDEVTRAFAGIHASYFNWQKPTESTAWISVKPLRVRNILVYVAGDAVRPGTLLLSSTVASLINVLTNAGGVKPSGSLRHLRISRADGKTEEHDLYGFLIDGFTTAVKTRLKYGETVFVPLKRKTVSIRGQVRRPGIYEMLEKESLRDLLEYAGGPAPSAYLKRVQVVRRPLNEGMQTLDVNFAELEDAGTTFSLLDGDHVEVFPAVEEEHVVYLKGGGVNRTGTFQFTERMTIADLIEKGEELRGEVYLEKAQLIRRRMDYTPELLSFSLEQLYRKNLETGEVELIGDKSNPENFALRRLDEITIYSYYEIIGKDKMVELEGHVKEPGEHLLAENMKLSDLLFAYGGFEDRDWRRATYLERADLVRTLPEDLSTTIIAIALRQVLEGDPEADLMLESMDHVVVYSYDEIKRKDKFVRLEGNVKQSGDHPLSENMCLSDLLFAYGGFEDEDFKKTTYLERADILRTNPEDLSVKVIPVNLRKVLEGDPEADLRLQSLDRVVIYEYKDFYPDAYFAIRGAVREPGRYLLAQNTILSDAIVMARGLLDEAYKYEAEIVRILPASASVEDPAQVIPVPISENYATESREKGFRLMKDDEVFIRTVPGWEKPREVLVEGEVRFPGEYILAKADERLSELVRRAGGLDNTAYLPGAALTRRRDEDSSPVERIRVVIDLGRALAQPSSAFDPTLRDGDELRVPINPMTVEVRGAVRMPATLQYRKGRGVSDYIRLCGGFREDALRRQTLVLNPDGTTAHCGWRWFEPRPSAGSVILVSPYEPIEEEAEIEVTTPPVSAAPGWPPRYPFLPSPELMPTSPTLLTPGIQAIPPWPGAPGAVPTTGPLAWWPEGVPVLPAEAAWTTETKVFPPLRLPIP